VNIPLLILGVALLVVALACAATAWNSEGRLVAIQEVPISTIQDVLARYRHDGGGFGQPCEISGVIECDAAIDGPLSGQSCVAYSHTVTWEEWGPPPRTGRPTYDDVMVRRGGATDVADRHVPSFWVRDATGRVLVDPLTARFDLKPIDEKYEVMSSSGGSERRSWHSEKALPVGHPIYVLGYIGERNSQPVIMRHRDTGKQFLISYRSERELTRATNRRANLFYVLAGIFAIGGLALLLWQAFR
jgi:hypothetical protein